MAAYEKKSVEQWLDEVDYDFPKYIPSEASLKFINFIKLVNYSKGGEENTSPVVHLKMLDSVFNKTKRTAIMCHRGIGKTTLMAEYMFLYIATFGKMDGFGKIEFAIYVADSLEKGARNLRKNIEFRYNSSDFLQQHIPKVKFTDTEIEFTNKDGHVFVLKLFGCKQGVRGAKSRGLRVQLAVIDDVISDDDARSDTILSTIEDVIHKQISKAMHPSRSKTIIIGTPFSQRDSLYKIVEAGSWAVSCYPIAENFDSLTTENTFNGSWPDRFPFSYVKDEYEAARAQGTLQGFYQELMLRVVSEEEKIFSDEDIVEYDYNIMKDNIQDMNIYITTDFATSEKSTSDFSAISVWGVNSNDDWIWIDGLCSRQLMNKNIDQLFKFVQQYKPMSVGIEVTGQQAGFIAWIKEEMIRRRVYFNLASANNSSREGIRPRKNKLERMLEVQPRFKQKKIWFPTNHKKDVVAEIKNEISSVTLSGIKSKHDDMLDTISMMPEMNIITPSDESLYLYDPIEDAWHGQDDDWNNNSYIID